MTRRRVLAALSGLVAAAMGLAVGTMDRGPASGQLSPLGALRSGRSAASALKAPLTGLLLEVTPPAAYLPLMSGRAIDATWAQLQPSAGAAITRPNAIDAAIAAVDAYNAATPGAHMRLKVRVMAGIWAPDWAKQLDGPPVGVEDPLTHATGAVGRFWTPNFKAAYDDLETKLAAIYDSAPEIAEVVASRCTTVYAEPFIRDITNPATVANLVAAGFSSTADQQCIQDMFSEHTVWTQTLTGVAFGAYQTINPDGSTGLDEVFPQNMIDTCRVVLGARCVLENDFLNAQMPASPVMTAMAVAGAPNGFQTAQCALVGSLTGALQVAISLGSRAVELCTTFSTLTTVNQLQPFPAALAVSQYVPLPPTAVTDSGQATGPSSAQLSANVTPPGVATTVTFEYGQTTQYGFATAPQAAGDIISPLPVSAQLGSLAPGTLYHFRVVATSASGVTFGSDHMFTTPPAATVFTRGAVANGTGLDISGTVNPHGQATSWYFEYGTDTSYGSTTPAGSAGSGLSVVYVAAPLTALRPGVVYHYQLVGVNPSGTSLGGDRTAVAPPPPVVLTGGAADAGPGALTVAGRVNPEGQATTYWFQYGPDSGYGSSSLVSGAGSSPSLLIVTAVISGLAPGGIYHYRLVAQNASGVSYGGDQTAEAD